MLDALIPQVHGDAATRPDALNAEAEFIHGDVRDKDAVARALKGVDSVVHLAAEVGVGQSMYEVERYTSTNDVGTAVLFEGALSFLGLGDPNASIPTPQPVHYRPMFGALGSARHRCRLTFLSQAAAENGVAERLNLRSATAVVKGCRTVQKGDMHHNGLLPTITVDSQTYEVRIDGELITSEPADVLPMAQRYFLF